MLRRLTEKIKLPESVRIPIIGAVWYRFILAIENWSIVHEKIPEKPLNNKKREIFITASLTSFPARINYVYLAIKSLLVQSYKPDRIILWLANEQFPDRNLPKNLTELQKYGLEIRWCDDNIFGHKKYYYCLKEQKQNEVIITFDDDIIYPIDCIRRLIETYNIYPSCLVCERAQSLPKDKNKYKNVGRWDTISDIATKVPSYSLCPSTGGGYLIPYNVYSKEMIDIELIKKYALKNDDMWCMFMATQNKTKFIKTRKYHRTFSVVKNSQEFQLSTSNIIENGAEDDFLKTIEAYPDAYNRILTDNN